MAGKALEVPIALAGEDPIQIGADLISVKRVMDLQDLVQQQLLGGLTDEVTAPSMNIEVIGQEATFCFRWSSNYGRLCRKTKSKRKR